jgi:hypothetical protein
VLCHSGPTVPERTAVPPVTRRALPVVAVGAGGTGTTELHTSGATPMPPALWAQTVTQRLWPMVLDQRAKVGFWFQAG